MLDFDVQFYKRMFESMDINAVMMLVEPDGTYNPIWCSREFCQMMEGTEEDFIRLESGGSMRTVHPDDRAAIAFLFKHHVALDGTNSVTVRKQTVKGRWIWVNIHYAFVEEAGKTYAYCTYANVTAIKESELRAHSNEAINAALTHKVLVQQYDMITSLKDGNYEVFIGDGANIGKGSIFPKERSGVYLDYIRDQVIPAADPEEHDLDQLLLALAPVTVDRALEEREPYIVDVTCRIDGEVFNKRFTFFTVEGGVKLLLKADMTDVLREQRSRNEQLSLALAEARAANVAKTAFLSSMSHEIRTPMNAIIGLDNIALKEPDLSGKTRDHLEKIGVSAKHLLELINDILDMSRIESGRMTLKQEEFSFQDLLGQINTLISGQCLDKGLTYDCVSEGSLDAYCIGDEMKLKQVLINILGNAVKFTPKGGKVTLRVEETGSFDGQTTVRFSVEDTGIGMDKDYLPRIFEAFSQEDATTTNQYGGSGLGMAITKNIVEMMNGTIAVESEKGVGTTFTVTVPLRHSDRTDGAAVEIDPQALRVLVIDDDPVALEHARLVLGEVGVDADTCLGGDAALEHVKLRHARHEDYDLILVDLKMPMANGIQVTKDLRQVVGENVAILILTAYTWDDIEEEALQAGVDSFLSKPLFASSVLEDFRRALARKHGSSESGGGADLTGKHLLLAEDVAINAEIMLELLEIQDMTADHAENGKLAVEMFDRSPVGTYDAVLMDIRMPEMDGLAAASAIRALDREDARTVPIIAMTANAFDEDVQRSLQAGMNAHLTKPVEPERLYETLGSLISD